MRPRSLLPKKRLNKEDLSMKPVLRLPALREKLDSRKPEKRPRQEDLLMRLKSRDKEPKRKPDTKPG